MYPFERSLKYVELDLALAVANHCIAANRRTGPTCLAQLFEEPARRKR
jgi:hypothetical protein